MYVYLSLGVWKVNGKPNPCTNLDEILHAHLHLPKKGFDAGLTMASSPPWAWGA